MSEIPTYGVYCYGTFEDQEVLSVMGFMEDYRLAKRLADFSLDSLGCVHAKVTQRMDDGSFECVYEINPLVAYLDVLDSLLQLRDAGELMPDPGDSPFFSTPCEPMAAV